MAIIKPFKGIYYNRVKVKLENVITQPYDKIDDKLYQDYLQRDPYNAVRLILKARDAQATHAPEGRRFLAEGEGAGSIGPRCGVPPRAVVRGAADSYRRGSTSGKGNPYRAQASIFKEWIEKGIFVQDAQEAIYCYDQEFTVFGQKKIRQSFIAMGLLEDYEAGQIFPHEETLSKPKADRLDHLRAMRTQFGLIFVLYEDPQNEISTMLHSLPSQEPILEFTDKDYGVGHRVRTVTDQEMIRKVSQRMKDKKLLIADGHHRYETALAYRDEMRKKFSRKPGTFSFDYAMMAFVNLYDPGLTILPTHRLVRNISDEVMMGLLDRLREDFKIERYALPQDHVSQFIFEKMRQAPQNAGGQADQDEHVIGLYYGASDFVLLRYHEKFLPHHKLKAKRSQSWRSLDVVLLHVLILQEVLGIREEAIQSESKLLYVREIDEALESVSKDRAQLAFFLNPTKPEIVRDIAFGHERMPQKSTDFFPKLMTGLLLNQMEF